MLKAIYRAVIIGIARSAAEQVANNMSESQLKDIGYTKYDIVQSAVESVTKELDEKDEKRRQKEITSAPTFSLWTIWALFLRKTAG